MYKGCKEGDTLNEKQKIILYYIKDNMSQREIHRVTGIARDTIRKYISEYVLGDVVEFNFGTVKLYTEDGILRDYQSFDSLEAANKHLINILTEINDKVS